MKNYIGTKIIKAKPMTRGEYNEHRGWTIPADENPADEGYLVQYDNDYVSWSPKDVFETAYREVTASEKAMLSNDNQDAPGNDTTAAAAGSSDTPAEASAPAGESQAA